MIRIDSHQHFWRLDRGDYEWLTPARPVIYRDFGIEDLAPCMKAAGVDATIAVQAAPTLAETEFLLDLADATAHVAGVVGWVDLAAADAPRQIKVLAARPKLVGLRAMLQAIPDKEWILDARLAPAFKAIANAALAFDALVRPEHLPALLRFRHLYPDIRLIVDHAAKPDIRGGAFPVWGTYLSSLAEHANVFCKLSVLTAQAGPGWSAETLAPYVSHVLASFGPERVMWGSDWPVCLETTTYLAWDSATSELLDDLSEHDRGCVLGGTAMAAYRLESGLPPDLVIRCGFIAAAATDSPPKRAGLL